jgi:hypothetical protein
MGHYDQDEIQKEHKHAQAQWLTRGATCVAFGNPTHLLDTANYVQCAWNSITCTTISNAWRRAEIFETLEQDEEEDVKDLDDGMFDEIPKELSDFNITEQEMNEFLNCNKIDSFEYIESAMEDVNDAIKVNLLKMLT